MPGAAESVSIRLPALLAVSTLLILTGSCGTGGGAGDRTGELVGGTLRPDALAYALAPASDVAPPGGLPSDLPPNVDLRREGVVPPVQNQRWNSCVAWSLGYYLMTGLYARRAVDGDFDFDVTESRNWFAPDYIYSQRDDVDTRVRLAPSAALCFETDGELGCMRPERAIEILLTQGCCKWNWMCTEASGDVYRSCDPSQPDPPTASSRRLFRPAAPGAASFRPRCFVRFGKLDQLDRATVNELRNWLHWQGTPISIVVKMTSGWLTYRGENRSLVVLERRLFCEDLLESRGVCLEAAGEDLGSQHMMTIVGYDEDFPSPDLYPGLPPEKRGSFLIVNQWGTKWGDQGYMWIPYSELEKIWIGAYGLIASPSPQDVVDPQGTTQCVPGPRGGWVELVEPDDVAINLDAANNPIGTQRILESGVDATGEVGHLVFESPGGALKGRDQADWFRFEIADTPVEVELTLTGADGGPLQGTLDLTLTDEDQFTIEGDHSPLTFWTTPPPASRHILRPLCTPGTYYVRILSRFNESSDYRLRLHVIPLAPDEPDDTICGARVLGMGEITRTSGQVGGGDPGDWFRVTTPPFQDIAIELGGSGADELHFEYWSGADAQSARRPLGLPFGGNELVEFGRNYLPYAFVRVFPKSLPSSSRLDYTLEVQRDADPATVVLAPTTGSPAAGWTFPPVSGRVHGGDRTDTYQVLVPWSADVTAVVTDMTDGESVSLDMVALIDLWEIEPALRSVVIGPNASARVTAPGGTLRLEMFDDPGFVPVRISVSNVAIAVGPGDIRQGDSTYRLALSAQLADRSGNPPGADDRLFLGRLEGGTLRSDHAEDLFRFTHDPGESQRYEVVVYGACASLDLTVIDTDGAGTLPLIDSGSTGDSIARQFTVPAGERRDVIVGLEFLGGADTGYQIALRKIADNEPGDGNDTPPMAQPLVLRLQHTDSVLGSDSRDYFRVLVPGEPGQLVQLSVDLSGVAPGAGLALAAWAGRGPPQVPHASATDDKHLDLDARAGQELIILVDAQAGPGSTYTLNVSPR